MSNGTIAGLTAGGQVVAGQNASRDGRFANYSGFLASVLMRPMLDTDGDGLCNELDGDNDTDGLPDGDELLADTNPNDFESALAFLSVARQIGGGMRLEWKGGIQARQVLMRRDSMTSGEWVALTTNLPPTPEVTHFGDNSATKPGVFYRIVADRAKD